MITVIKEMLENDEPKTKRKERKKERREKKISDRQKEKEN